MSLETVTSEALAFLGGINSKDLRLQRTAFDAVKSAFVTVSKETGIPAGLLAGVAWSESNFNATARNASSGAAGLMQIIPANFPTYFGKGDPYNVLANVRAGAKDLLAKGYGKKSLLAVIAGYNGYINRAMDPDKLAAFTLYYRRITARWAFLTTNGLI